MGIGRFKKIEKSLGLNTYGKRVWDRGAKTKGYGTRKYNKQSKAMKLVGIEGLQRGVKFGRQN